MKTTDTVFVGLSGGVDSSVAALRLLRAGYRVVGVFIRVWQPDWLECDWEKERLDAMRVAARLGIPFLTCDARERYHQDVGEYFVSEYLAGRTPNPDVMCNQHIKFGAFLDFADAHGARYVATGHYARRGDYGGRSRLYRGADREKDQSYFLWTLRQAQLERVLLPLGDTDKTAVRVEAAAANLPTAVKKDSQGICFLGHIDIKEFLGHFTELRDGPVLSEAGETIGTHQGALVYTLGQRHGFSLAASSADQAPQYVISRDLARNTITVSPQKASLAPAEAVTLSNVNWINQPVGRTLLAQFRYRQTPLPVTIERDGSTLLVQPTVSTERPAAGQSCVLYDGDECIGGGIIAG